ncbi:MAG TPA: helix-turn-helix transcriptional regulator [Candidatus Dojkabacteria bacterium]|nr:helix-turn-helix transcriptional regulator [Candidatus Dojkabacteria bacterium]
MEETKILTDRILEYRVRNSLTVVQFADQVGISPVTVSKLFNGKNTTAYTQKRIDLFLKSKGF